MKKLLSLLPLALTGCGTCEEITLTPDERAWLGPYQDGTTLTFRSNRGSTNTLHLNKRQEWHTNTDCNKLESGPYQPIFSQIVLQPATPYDTKHPYFTVNIRKHNPDRIGVLQFDLAGLTCDTDAAPGKPTAQLQQQAVTLTTTGKAYPSAYVFRSGQNAKTYGNGRLQAFYWDKQDGLIRYDLADGEIFELVAR